MKPVIPKKQTLNNSMIWLSFISFIIYTTLIHVNLYEFVIGKMPLIYSLLMAVISVIGFLIFMYMVLNYKASNFNLYDVLVISFILYMIMVIFMDYYFYGKSYKVYHENIVVTIRFIGLYFAGRYFLYKKSFLKFLILSFLILSIEKIINLDIGLMHIALGNGSNGGYYLFFGDTYAMLAIVFISVLKNPIYKIVVIFVAIFVLFIVYSRTSLYLFVIIQVVATMRDLNFKQKIIGVIASFLFFATIINSIGFDSLVENRMLNVISTGEDRSLNEREIFFQKGIKAISKSPFIGDYAGQYYNDYSFGHYMHNIISFYRQFGIPAVLFMVYFFYRIFFYYYKWYRGKYGNKLDYAFYLGLFIFLEVFLARTYTTLHFWFALGLFANVLNDKQGLLDD